MLDYLSGNNLSKLYSVALFEVIAEIFAVQKMHRVVWLYQSD